MRSYWLLMLVALAAGSAQADSAWLGNVQVRLQHRSLDRTTSFDGQPIVYNLGDYNTFTISFEFYEQGVTDNSGVSVWQSIDAKVELIKDSTQEVINSGTVPIVGRDGNNVVYSIYLPGLNPSTVASLDPELQNRGTMKTHLNVALNGGEVLSIPINYQYAP